MSPAGVLSSLLCSRAGQRLASLRMSSPCLLSVPPTPSWGLLKGSLWMPCRWPDAICPGSLPAGCPSWLHQGLQVTRLMWPSSLCRSADPPLPPGLALQPSWGSILVPCALCADFVKAPDLPTQSSFQDDRPDIPGAPWGEISLRSKTAWRSGTNTGAPGQQSERGSGVVWLRAQHQGTSRGLGNTSQWLCDYM